MCFGFLIELLQTVGDGNGAISLACLSNPLRPDDYRAPLSRRRRSENSHPQIIKELRCRIDACHKQVISCTGASDVKQVAFRVVDFFQIRVVGHRLDPFLQGNDLIITGHHDNGTELQAFGKMHGAEVTPISKWPDHR